MMETRAVPWQRVAIALLAVGVVLMGVIVAVRADGFAAVDATVPRATRWFVHQATGRVVLADGFSGQALARLDTEADGQVLEVAQSPSGVVVVDRSAATTRTVDASALRLGPPQSLGLVAEPTTLVGVSQPGLVAVDRQSGRALLVPSGGETVPFDQLGAVGSDDDTRIAPDGAIWTLALGELSRVTTTGRETMAGGLTDARFSLVGVKPFLLDADRGRIRLGRGVWVDAPAGVDVSELVLQEPGPAAECGWVGSGDQLWCIDEGGVVTSAEVDGLGVAGADRLAISGDAGALVRRSPSEIVRIDWRAGRVLDDVVADPTTGATLAVAASTDLIWVDETNGSFVWAVNPWGVSAIEKNDAATPLLGESGELIAEGSGGRNAAVRGGEDTTGDIEREPDDNGIDDPPVAVDDPVTARAGTTVPVAVTANDYDPDGEAIAVDGVGEAGNGSVEIVSASTVVYQPRAGYVGLDEFEYTIVDGNGTEATAMVSIELLAADAANQAPTGSPDSAETGPDAEVIIDVLANDVDPERDSLRIASFTPADVGGAISEAPAPSGLPGLRFDPPPGASGTATFSYRPVDSFGAVGEPVEVRVEIAQPSDANRPPVLKPDAARVRRDIPVTIPVLANDRDPDGDRLRVGLIEPFPPGLDVRLEGNDIVVTARTGIARLSPFAYSVDDGNGNVVTGSVLVALIDDVEPNRPPIANADTAAAVVGTTQLIDVLANDSDPDGDPLVLVSVERTGSSTVAGVPEVRGDAVRYTAAAVVTDEIAIDRFSYTISDGNGHEVSGEVSVRVLPEAIAAPPFAQDDAATTVVDVPVTLDVLRNDGDPSGERPSLVGSPGCAGGGTAVVTADSRVTFRPPAGRSGVFNCSYEVRNSQGLRASATIVVTVLQPPTTNTPPEVEDEDVIVVIGETVTVDVLANDTDPDGPTSELRVLSSTRPTLGTATRMGGSIEFFAGPVPGVATITYQVGDAGGGVTTGRLIFRIVEPDPVPPFATEDTRTITGPGVPTVIDVLGNDGDPDGDADELRLVSAERTSGDGSVTATGNTITFRPEPEFVGDLVASYTIEDTDGLRAVGRAVLIVLEAPNRPPIVENDNAQVVNGGSVTIPIADNDLDPDGDLLTYTIVDGPDTGLGTARLELGSLVFDAVPGASGVANVVYRVDDGEDSADGRVTITVLPCAVAPPEAPDLFFETGYEQPIAIDLTATALNGEVVEVGAPLGVPSGVYTPPPGENGNVTFTYAVRNSCRIQDVGQVVIDVNQAPLGAPLSAAISRIEPTTFPVTSLASDDEALRIVGLDGAPDWVAVTDDQQTLFVDPAGRTGRVVFTVVVADPGGLQVSVPVTLDLVNLAPIAQPDVLALGDGPGVVAPLVNDLDPDGDPIGLAAVPTTLTFTNGEVGTITQQGDGELLIDARSGLGVATFEYTIVDAPGLVSAPAVITVTVNRTPLAPDVPIEVDSGGTITAAVPATDPEGARLVLEIIGDPAPVTLGVDGLNVTVTAPDTDSRLTIDVVYRVTDPQGAFAEGVLEIVVKRAPPPTTTTTVPPTTTTTTTTPPTTAPPTTAPTTVPPTTAPPTTAPPTTEPPTTAAA